jgi:tetratricopeptide (TPR) repeat protein
MEMVIRAANGFSHPDDGRLTKGEFVEIPETTVYMYRADDTWESIAERYLASRKRGSFLSSMNGYKDGKIPPEGTLIKLPYHLRHIFAPRETLKSVLRLYLHRKVTIRWLKAYNLTRKKRFHQGDALIVPLIDLRFVEKEQKRVDKERAEKRTDVDARNQARALLGIAEIKKAYDAGNYVKTVAIAGRLVGRGGLTVPQEIGIHNYLAFTYVALGEEDLAIEAFGRAIELQPGMALSTITTSPKILIVFNRAKELMLNAQKNKKPKSEK